MPAKKILLSILFLILAAALFKTNASAGTFSQASILLSRGSVNTAVTALVCITTPGSDNGSEDNVRITFPNSFTVNSSASNWTVSTANIPNDASSWPGIGTATGVSGQIVTFPSSNLSVNTKYCFRTTNSTSLTTASSSGSHKGTIITYQVNSPVDSSGFGLNVGSDQISIEGTVPANSNDFEAEIALTDPSGDTFAQDTTLTYTITYGSNLASNSNIEVQAEWSLGTISGSGTPTIEILDYVVGSASNGYNSTPPVIDTVGRTITWTINSFPASTTGETVSFQLKTNDSYTGSETVSFDVSGRVLGPGTQTPDSTVTKDYQYSETITPTPTPGPTSASTDTGPTGTPTPTSSPAPSSPLVFENVEVRQISPNSAQIFVLLNKNADITINYGTSLNNLTGSTTLNLNSNYYLINLGNLNPNTQYFFTITALSSGESLTSDIFTFTTSESGSIVKPIYRTFMVISKNTLIYSQSLADENKLAPFVIIPTNKAFTFSIALENSSQIKSVQAFLRNKFVLLVKDELLNVNLIQTSSGEYTGLLGSGFKEGIYELYLRISDKSGNIFEEKAGEFRIVKPLTVLEKKTNRPVEGATVKIFTFNESSRLYEELNQTNSSLTTPLKTHYDGTLDIVLPQGKYRAEVSSFLYKKQQVEFVLGSETGETYPTVYLEKAPFSLILLASYLFETGKDFYKNLSSVINGYSRSVRLFELISFLIIAFFTLTAFISLLFRTRHTPQSIYHYVKHIVTPNKLKSDMPLKGVIKDHTGKPLPEVVVTFLKKGDVISQTTTNINGVFYTRDKNFEDIQASKKGFQEKAFPFNHQMDEKTPIFILEKNSGHLKTSAETFTAMIKISLGLLFEALFFLLFLLELLFIPTLGILKVAPFLMISMFMLIVFIHQNVIGKGRYF